MASTGAIIAALLDGKYATMADTKVPINIPVSRLAGVTVG